MKIAALAFAALFFGPAVASAATTKNLDVTVTPPSGTCAGGPTVSVVEAAPPAGSPIHVNFACGPGNQHDWIAFGMASTGQGNSPYQYVNGATSGTLTFTAPNATSDRDLQYIAVMHVNDTYTEIAESAPFTVPATVNPPAPTAMLPGALAADPFTPQHVITVCLAGCDFASVGDAFSSAIAKGWDFVQVKVSAGDYPYPDHALVSGCSLPQHSWVRGISSNGHTYPHIFGVTQHAGQIFGTGCYLAPTTASLTLDNLELGPWNARLFGAGDSTNVTLRNVYVRDSSQGLISGNAHDFVLNIYNTVFARHGSGNGPEHDIYVGEGAGGNVVNVVNSVFEQAVIGHAFKNRASTFNAKCSMFLVNQDNVYDGSETLDMSDGGAVTLTNILSSSGAGAGPAYGNNTAWDNMRYGAEGAITGYVNTPMIAGSVFLGDDPGVARDFFTMFLGIRLDHAPITWSGNTFVYAAPFAQANWNNVGGVAFVDTTRPPAMASTSDIVVDSTNHVYTSRAAAGLPPVGTYPKGWRDFMPMMPAACTDPVGLVKIPAN